MGERELGATEARPRPAPERNRQQRDMARLYHDNTSLHSHLCSHICPHLRSHLRTSVYTFIHTSVHTSVHLFALRRVLNLNMSLDQRRAARARKVAWRAARRNTTRPSKREVSTPRPETRLPKLALRHTGATQARLLCEVHMLC